MTAPPDGPTGPPLDPTLQLDSLHPDALHQEALGALRALTGRADAVFHDGQFEAISALVGEGRRVLVVQRTGWGKSAVYFLSALLQRRRGRGPALIVSPLIALMRDQVAAAARAGVRAVAISSANATEWEEIEQRLAAADVDALLVSPERLVNPRFRSEHLPRLVERMGLLVIDEAHCISDWGHDFRPDYRRIRDLVAQLDPRVPVLATTATANGRVVADIEEQIGRRRDGTAADVLTVRGPLTRDSLRLGCVRLPDDRDRLAYLAQVIDSLPGSGIVYALTVSAAEDLATLLDAPHRPVRAYTGRTDPDTRAELEEDLRHNRVKALAATSALGMGFDKPDLGFVVHLGAPSSPVAYYQQVGRAGRATDRADVLLLPGQEDPRIWEYFATASMPDQDRADRVLEALAEADGPLSVPALEARVDIRRTPLDLLLKVLAVDGAAEAVRGGWRATGQPWQYDAERYGRIAAARRAEQQAMLDYESTDRCRMVVLAEQLDDDTARPCGRCDVCAGPWYPDPAEAAAGGEARARVEKVLDRAGVPVEPRAQWPSGAERLRIRDATGQALTGRIPTEHRAETGRVLARTSDLGWAARLRDLLAVDAQGEPIDTEVPADIGQAVVRVLAGWDWQERPAGVIAVPSMSRPRLVGSLAQGLATVGRLPLLPPLQLTEQALQAGRPRSSGNSAFRLAAVASRLSVGEDLAAALADLDGAPVLLVDDVIDSRWTLTVAAHLLRRAGSGPVLPLALAQVG
ncbi:ATP-dependent DNA helicase RecQ [Brachybacterium sp. EF45031]|uniref:RecQ family ATP-dependent DNA helicase n=1 Tax=Brachybacterium sillae TaxID=2810536 RepID=UPI00217D53E7|nr:DEAD/DEAH box helicase [Brachybacterium sillae]MCS6711714.1 ATP-dependent DNA helicase RecQ [Brachybacterium sillae]